MSTECRDNVLKCDCFTVKLHLNYCFLLLSSGSFIIILFGSEVCACVSEYMCFSVLMS